MKVHLRIFLTLLFFLFLCYSNLLSQTKDAIIDSTFEAYMDSAGVDIKESNYSDNLQNKYADDFYAYYLQHPDTKTGKEALTRAFVMWSNTGAAEKTDQAMSQLAYDSEIWSRFIHFVGNTYFKSEQRTQQDYVDLLQKLNDKLTHPESKSAVLWRLGDVYHRENQPEKVKEVARETVNLNANEFHVEQALGLLYELDSLSVGKEAPNFRAQTVDGDSLSLADHRGNFVLLEFWATWCGPCIPEIPHLKSIQSKYSDDELQIIGISLDNDTKKLKQFIQEREITWPQIFQPQKWNDKIVKLYNVSGIPRTYIVGRDGKIVAKDLRGEELEKEIAKLVNQ